MAEPLYYPVTYEGGAVSASFYEEMEKDARERVQAAVIKAAAILRADKENHQINVETKVLGFRCYPT